MTTNLCDYCELWLSNWCDYAKKNENKGTVIWCNGFRRVGVVHIPETTMTIEQAKELVRQEVDDYE